MSDNEKDDRIPARLRAAELFSPELVTLPAGWAVAGRATVRLGLEGKRSPPQPEPEKSEMLAVLARCCASNWRGVLLAAVTLAYASRASRLARSLAGTLPAAVALAGLAGAVRGVAPGAESGATVKPESAEATRWSVVSLLRI